MNLCYFLFEPQSSQESEATSCVLSSRHLQIGFTVLNLYLSKENLALTGCFDHTCSGVWGCWSLLARTSRKVWTWRSSAYFHSRQGPQLDIFIPVSPILIIRCLDKVPIRVQWVGRDVSTHKELPRWTRNWPRQVLQLTCYQKKFDCYHEFALSFGFRQITPKTSYYILYSFLSVDHSGSFLFLKPILETNFKDF